MSFFDKMIEVAKSMGVKDFGYYKKWALDHLKKQLKEEDTVTKALEYCEEYMEKAYGIGTIRTWKGKKYIKGPDKKWRRYFDKHDRGANQAIKNIMREINSLENGDVEGLYAIIQKNAGRFRDENGNVLPEVQQIHDLVEKKQSESGKEEKKNSFSKTDFNKLVDKYLISEKDSVNNPRMNVYYNDFSGKTREQLVDDNLNFLNSHSKGNPETQAKGVARELLMAERYKREHKEEKKDPTKELSPLQKYENSIRDEKYEQARKDAEMRNQNQKKDGISDEVNSSVKESENSVLKTVIEKYASDKQIASVVKKIDDMDFVRNDENYASLSGVFHDDGYKVATEGHVLSMIKSDYPKEDEGKIKGSNYIMKYIDKKIENLKKNYLPNAEANLDRAAKEQGTGSRLYEMMNKKLEDLKKEIADLEEQKNTGNIKGNFPSYKKVIPSMGNNPNYSKANGFDDFDKVLKTAMVAAAYRKANKEPIATVKVGNRVFDADKLVKVMAMAKKHGLSEILGDNENPTKAIEFKGDKGSVVIMPMYGDTKAQFDANDGTVSIEDQDKADEFLSGGEKETSQTFLKNRLKYEKKFDKDIIDIMNHFHKEKGLKPVSYGHDSYLRTAKSPDHITSNDEEYTHAMNDLKDLYHDYSKLREDIYDKRVDDVSVNSSQIKTFFEDGVKKIKDKYGIKKSFSDQIMEISKSVKEKSQPGQKHDLEYYKKWAMSILDKQEETVDEPNEDTVVKALEYCETMMKSGYPVGTIREWKGQKYIKIAPNKWKPKYDNMGSRGAKMSLSNLKKAVAKCNSEEELFNLINSNASRFRDENGNPFPEVQELHDMVTKRQDEIENTSNKNEETPDNGSSENADSGKPKTKTDKKKMSTSEKIEAIQNAGKKGEAVVDKLGNGNVEGVALDAGNDSVNAVKTAAKDQEKKPVAAQNVLTPSDLEGDSENETFESLTEKYNATKDPDEREKILNKIMSLEKEKNDTIKDMKEQRKEDLTKKYSETTDPDEREKILNEMMNLDRQEEEKILPAMFDKEDEGFDAWDKDQKVKYGDKSVEELQKLLDTKYKNVKKYTPEYSEAMKIGDMIQQKKRQKK